MPKMLPSTENGKVLVTKSSIDFWCPAKNISNLISLSSISSYNRWHSSCRMSQTEVCAQTNSENSTLDDTVHFPLSHSLSHFPILLLFKFLRLSMTFFGIKPQEVHGSDRVPIFLNNFYVFSFQLLFFLKAGNMATHVLCWKRMTALTFELPSCCFTLSF